MELGCLLYQMHKKQINNCEHLKFEQKKVAQDMTKKFPFEIKILSRQRSLTLGQKFTFVQTSTVKQTNLRNWTINFEEFV